MTTFYPKFYITLGSLGNSSVYIKDSSGDWQEFVSFDYFKVVKRQNQISEFELHVYDIQDAEKVYVKEFAEIMFFSEHNLILKGRVQKVTYETAYECTATGFGIEAKLLEKELIKSGDKRVQYTNTSAQDIANEILSENTDGSTPWIIEPISTGIFDTDYGNISIRYEYGNRLNALAKLAEAIDYEWWISQGDDYDDDYFNLASRTSVSQQTFTITGDNANCIQTAKEKDITNLANKIDGLGYGDGVNQLHTSCYNASATYSTLSADITNTSTTIGLTDASDFASSGTVRIMEEQVTYSGKSDNNLTGCTRAANSTTARAHKKNVFVEKHITIANAESGSSIGDNVLSDYTAINKDIPDISTLELVASRVLLERMDPIARIRIIPDEPLETAGARDIGELITITDAESDIDTTHRIVGMTYESNYGDLSLEIEANNKILTLIEQMQKQREQQENTSRYMQGTTNILTFPALINANNSVPLKINAQIPSSFIYDGFGNRRVNSFTLDYDVDKYRKGVGGATSIQSTTGAGMTNAGSNSNAGISNAGSNSNAGMTNANKGSSDNGYFFGNHIKVFPTIDDSWHSLTSSYNTGSYNYDFHAIFVNIQMKLKELDISEGSVWVFVRAKNTTDTIYWPGSEGLQMISGLEADSSAPEYLVPSTFLMIPFNWTNKNYVLEYRITDGADFGRTDIIDEARIRYSYMGLRGHTHSNTFNDASHTNPNTFNDASHTNPNTFNDANHNHDVSIGDSVSDADDVNASQVNIYVDWYNTGTSQWDNKHSILNTGKTLDTDVDISNGNILPDAAGYWRVRIITNNATPDLVQGIIKLKHQLDT